MRPNFRIPWMLAMFLPLLLVAAVTSCNSSNAPTAPGGGGGGNGGGGGGAAELNSGTIGPNGTYTHRFATAGSFGYHCIFHTPMTGTVQVSAAAADSVANVSITSSTTTFPGASVRPGGTVTWTNNTGLDHTVTSN